MQPAPFRFFLCLGWASALSASVWADTASDGAQQSAYRSSIAQEGVRKQTDKIEVEISQLIKELKLNGFDNAELTLLSNASGHLKSLSQEDMQKVINALQSASLAAQTQDRQQTMVGAFQQQQAIALNLKSLAADLAAEESQKELPAKLENLIVRQSTNIRQTKTLGGASAPEQLDAPSKTTHDLASSEQASIGAAIDFLSKGLAVKPDVASAQDAGEMAKAVLDAMNGSSLQGEAQAATHLTTAGPFPDAVTKQSSVLDHLGEALRAAMAHVDAATQLQEAKTQVDRLLADQKDVASTAQEAKVDHSTLAERQAQMEDRAAATQARLKATSPTAATEMEKAQQAMSKSTAALAQAKNPAETAPQQQAAVEALKKTSEALEQQIAATQKADAMSPVDKMAQLQKVQSEIAQAQQNPQTSAADMQKIQQDAAPVSPEAASDLGDAADQKQKAQPDNAAAQQSLAKANDAVQKQQEGLKKDAEDFQALSDLSKKLAEAQEQTKSASQSIKDTPANLTPAAHDLTQAQANVDDTQKGADQAKAPDDAKQALKEASEALKAGATQAVQAQAAGAQAQAGKAAAAMQKAQDGLAQAMAQIQKKGKGNAKGMGQGLAEHHSDPAQIGGPGYHGNQILGGVGGAGGIGQVIGGLKSKDRDAISQYQAEKSPPEYAPLVQQYLKNLADSSEGQ